LIVESSLVFSIRDRDVRDSSAALENAFVGRVDQVEYLPPRLSTNV
jgi:hypothetical protein